MSCALCSKWQHILCHNKRDQAAGHAPRNWDSVEFICQGCRQLDGSSADSMLSTKQAPQHSDAPQAAASYMIPDVLRPSGSFLQEGSFRGSYDRRPTSSSQGHFVSSALSSTSNVRDPPLASTPRQMISFSDHHPPEHGFSPNEQRTYRADPAHPVYGNRQSVATTLYKLQVLFIIFSSNTG